MGKILLFTGLGYWSPGDNNKALWRKQQLCGNQRTFSVMGGSWREVVVGGAAGSEAVAALVGGTGGEARARFSGGGMPL